VKKSGEGKKTGKRAEVAPAKSRVSKKGIIGTIAVLALAALIAFMATFSNRTPAPTKQDGQKIEQMRQEEEQQAQTITINVGKWIKGGETANTTLEGIAVDLIAQQKGITMSPQDVKGEANWNAVYRLVGEIAKQNGIRNINAVLEHSTLTVTASAVQQAASAFSA